MEPRDLLKEVRNGRLAVIRIAGKTFVTAADIKDMIRHSKEYFPPPIRLDLSPAPARQTSKSDLTQFFKSLENDRKAAEDAGQKNWLTAIAESAHFQFLDGIGRRSSNETYTVRQLARVLQCHPKRLHDALNAGRLVRITPGRNHKIHGKEAIRWCKLELSRIKTEMRREGVDVAKFKRGEKFRVKPAYDWTRTSISATMKVK
jgi:hypothetical protein